MPNKNLKQIVEEIQKQAGPKPPVPPAGYKPEGAPAPAQPTGAATRPVPKPGVSGKPAVPGAHAPAGRHGFPSSAEVRKMQEALINLANIASSTDVTSMQGNKDGVMEGKQTRQIPAVDALPTKGRPSDGQMGDKDQYELSQQTKDDKNYLGGSDPFGKFLVQNYIGKDSFIGKQYLNVDVAGQNNREHASMNPTNLRGIIDTIKRIGSPNAKGERVVDGVWQTRTNNALHVVSDLVEAIMGLSTDMGVKLAAYNPGYLANFKKLVPDSWNMMKSQEEVNKRAEVITQHLNAMTKMFQQFNNDVLNNKAIRQFIDQKEAFVSFPRDTQIPPELRASGIPGVQFNWVENPAQNWISLNELSSLDNFKSFLRRVRISDQDSESIKKTLALVEQAINSKTTADPGY